MPATKTRIDLTVITDPKPASEDRPLLQAWYAFQRAKTAFDEYEGPSHCQEYLNLHTRRFSEEKAYWMAIDALVARRIVQALFLLHSQA